MEGSPGEYEIHVQTQHRAEQGGGQWGGASKERDGPAESKRATDTPAEGDASAT